MSYKIIFFLAGIFYALAAESNDISENEDPGDCICDLTADSCDVYCCCDSECSDDLVKEWDNDDPEENKCVEESYSDYGQTYCVNSQEFYIDNARRGMKTATDTINKLLCVEVDNSPTMGRFYDLIEDGDVSQDTIDTRIDDNVEYSDMLLAPAVSNDRITYQVGEAIGSILDSSWKQFGFRWPVPAPDVYGQCNDMNSARWMISQDYESCSRLAKPIDICNTVLDVDSYTTLLQISTVPTATSSSYIKISSVEYTVRDVEKNIDTTGGSAVSTSRSGNCECKNALLEAHYIVYTNETQDQPSRITASVVVGDLNSCDSTYISQKFSIQFYTTENAKKLSGNPGYQAGKPVFLSSRQSGTTIYDVYESGLPLLGAGATGECLDSQEVSANTPVITFREETIFSCYLEFDFDELADYCAKSTTGAIDNRTKPVFNWHNGISHVGKFGNIDLENADDWVEISTSNQVDSGSWNADTGVCVIPNILVYDFVTYEIGAVTNPQPKIIYARKYFKSNT
jgi:tectonic-1/3